MGGTPSPVGIGWGTLKHESWFWWPTPLSGLGGVPSIPVKTRWGYPPPIGTGWGYPPVMTGWGYPLSHRDSVGYPHIRTECGYPYQDWVGGTPWWRLDGDTPCCQDWMGVLPLSGDRETERPVCRLRSRRVTFLFPLFSMKPISPASSQP